jgi:hypothetical protein
MKKDIIGSSRMRSDVKGTGRMLAAAQMSLCAFHPT